MGEVMDVVGQIELRREKGRFRLEEVWLGPLAVMRAAVYEPEGLVPWRLARRLRRAERALARAGAGRVVLGRDFPYGDRLALLRPVDPLPFWRGCADVLALGALEAEGAPPSRGRAALSAPRLCPELERAAERLCPRVRGLLIDAPGGADYARHLLGQVGLPVLPPAERGGAPPPPPPPPRPPRRGPGGGGGGGGSCGCAGSEAARWHSSLSCLKSVDPL